MQGTAAVGLSTAAWAGFPCKQVALRMPRPWWSPRELMRSRSIPRCRSMASRLLWRAVYENLVKYEGDTLEIVPHLAESYEISPDGLTYTFKIRPGISFRRGAVECGRGETLD